MVATKLCCNNHRATLSMSNYLQYLLCTHKILNHYSTVKCQRFGIGVYERVMEENILSG